MTEISQGNLGGRPLKQETRALTAALIEKQDSLSLKRGDSVNDLLDRHVSAARAMAAWCRIADATREHMLERVLPAAAERLGLPAGARARLRELFEEALTPLVVTRAARRLAALADAEPEEARAVVYASESLAGARAQSAQLEARRIRLRRRIRPLDPKLFTYTEEEIP